MGIDILTKNQDIYIKKLMPINQLYSITMVIVKHWNSILFSFYILFVASIFYGSLSGYLTFGFGLGDLLKLGELVFTLIIIIVVYFLTRKNYKYIFCVFIILFTVYFSLGITIFRGSEHKWDGNVFYKKKETKSLNKKFR